MLVADPHRAGHLLDQLQMGRIDRIAHRRGEDEIMTRAVAVLDVVEVEDRPPPDAELPAQLDLGRSQVRHDDADVVVRRQRWRRLMGAGSRRRRRARGR